MCACGPVPALALHHTYVRLFCCSRKSGNPGQHACTCMQLNSMLCKSSLWCHVSDAFMTDCWLCGADPYSDDLKRFAAAVPVVTYAINDRSADVYAEKVVMGIWESEITVRTPIGHLRIITPLIGRNNVYNVLAAVATGLSINVPLKVRHSSLLQTSSSMGFWHAWHLPVHMKGAILYQTIAVRPACACVAGVLWLTLTLGLSA